MPRVKSHFKIHSSIASHRNTAVMWKNMRDRAIYVSLGLVALEKYAAKTDDTFHLSTSDLMVITGCESAGAAGNRWRSFLRHCEAGATLLGGCSPLTATLNGGHWTVTWRNYAKKQGFTAKNVDETSNPNTEANTEAKAKKSRREPSTFGLQLASRLREKLFHLNPTHKRPNLAQTKAWARDYDLAIRLDNREPAGIVHQLEWIFGDTNQAQGKYASVVESGSGHRKKYDKIADRITKLQMGEPDPDLEDRQRGDRQRAAQAKREAAELEARNQDMLEARRDFEARAH